MIQFPETARSEWEIVADAANAEQQVRRKIERGTLVENELEKMRIRHEAKVMLDQEINADLTPELKMFTLANFQNGTVAAPADLIDGVLKDDGLCVMVGPAGSGKSTLALQMLHSLMTGEDWLCQTTKPLSGAVGVLSYDMPGALMADWMNGFPGIDPGMVNLVDAYKTGNPLGVPAMRAQIVEAWRQSNTEVIIIDSFSASFFGTSQNDAAEVMNHYRELKRFALQEVGARAVVIIAHSTMAAPEKIRGSTVHEDVADSIVVVNPNQKTKKRTVTMAKYRAARGQFEMDPRIVTAPDVVTHLVELDPQEMLMEGMSLPAGVSAAAFRALPDSHDDPDTDSDEDDEL